MSPLVLARGCGGGEGARKVTRRIVRLPTRRATRRASRRCAALPPNDHRRGRSRRRGSLGGRAGGHQRTGSDRPPGRSDEPLAPHPRSRLCGLCAVDVRGDRLRPRNRGRKPCRPRPGNRPAARFQQWRLKRAVAVPAHRGDRHHLAATAVSLDQQRVPVRRHPLPDPHQRMYIKQ